MVSRLEVEGDKLSRRLLSQIDDSGGAFGYITGAMGGGKTSGLLFFLQYTMKYHPDQFIFLSETYDSPLQVFKIGENIAHFMVMEHSNVIFRDRNRHLKEVDLNPTYFKAREVQYKKRNPDTNEVETRIRYIPDFEDLYRKAKTKRINIPFFGSRLYWMDFIAFLRHTGEWNHIFVDEIGEVIPTNTGGLLHRKIGEFANFSKDIRKCKLKVFSNTQSVRDVDWRIRDKFMYRIFLPGALADPKHSRVAQRAIDNLQGDEIEGNNAYIDSRGKFGLITFTNIFKPNPNISIEAHIKTSEEYQLFGDEV